MRWLSGASRLRIELIGSKRASTEVSGVTALVIHSPVPEGPPADLRSRR